MSNNYNSSSSGSNTGISFLGVLQVALIVLKLLDKIKWSWWWVWCPTWIPTILLIVFLVMLYLIK